MTEQVVKALSLRLPQQEKKNRQWAAQIRGVCGVGSMSYRP